MTKLHYKTTELLLVSFGINSIRLRHKKYLQSGHSVQTNLLMYDVGLYKGENYGGRARF